MSIKAIINGVLFGLALWLAIVFVSVAFAGDDRHDDGAEADARSYSESDSESRSYASNGDVLQALSVTQRRLSLLIETDPAVGNAPCMVVRPAWGFGFRGSKTVIDPACMASALQDAQHVREMERLKAELERARLELERDRLMFERQRFDRELQFARDELELCGECGKQ